MFHGGGPSKWACSRYALSQSMTSSDMISNLLPGVHRFVGVHVAAIPAQHLCQRRGPAHAAVLQCPHGRYLPAGTVAPRSGPALDDTEEPVAHLGVHAPALQ